MFEKWLTHVYKKLFFCVTERRVPFRKRRPEDLVDRRWYRALGKELDVTAKIKVGFGPIVSGENDLHVRKWRIDPIVNRINAVNGRYCAGIFLTPESMDPFDVITIVRECGGITKSRIAELQAQGKKVLLDVVDRPYLEELARGSGETLDVIRSVDGIISSNPLQTEDLHPLCPKVVLIEHPVLNTQAHDYSKKSSPIIRIIWQGFYENHWRMHALHPIIMGLANELHKDIRIVYHTNALPRRDGLVEYRTWTVRNWEKVLVEGDIAVEIKSPNDPLLSRKPATKVLTYMAAGLPVVCTPSSADCLVLDHGRTGFFALTPEDWRACLKRLIEDPGQRQAMGEAGREYAVRHFRIENIARKYTSLLDELTGERRV